MGTARVLVVDDERKIREVVGSYLTREGYTVLLAETGEAALDLALREHPDLVVLDLKLPDLAGEEVARAIRKVSELPIIMLTAKSAEADRLAGLGLGADDYLVKPFSVRELAARVAAVLRRTKGRRSEISLDEGRLVIDPASRTARLDGERLTLTRTEFDLLLALVSGFPRVLSREQAFSDVFVSFLLARNARIQEDLIDQLFNSSEKRLARVLLLLAQFGKEGKPEIVIPKISQESLAEMVGTTRSRVSFFMNRFRKMGFIEYDGSLKVHSSLLNVVLHD